jgi:hypothetical protein
MVEMISKDDFQKMPFESKVSFLLDRPEDLPGDMTEQGIEILSQAGEIERAAMLARDRGMIKKAIDLLVNAGDYLWAALIAKNAGNVEESRRLYKNGLVYYVDMEMYGRAISAATALKMPADEIDELFRKGVVAESRGMDLSNAKAMIENAMDSLEIAIMGKEDEISRGIMSTIQSERERTKEKVKSEKGDRLS